MIFIKHIYNFKHNKVHRVVYNHSASHLDFLHMPFCYLFGMHGSEWHRDPVNYAAKISWQKCSCKIFASGI